MTNEQILKLAETCGADRHISKMLLPAGNIYWECDEEDLLKFARAMYDEGYDYGYDEGYSNCSIDMGDENV